MMSMKWLIIVGCLPVALLVGGFLVLLIRDRPHPSCATKEEVRKKLRRVLDGTMTYYEWRDFTHIPLKHDPMLENIRQACIEMENQGSLIHRDDPKMTAKWIYNEKGLERVKELLLKLEDGIESAGR